MSAMKETLLTDNPSLETLDLDVELGNDDPNDDPSVALSLGRDADTGFKAMHDTKIAAPVQRFQVGKDNETKYCEGSVRCFGLACMCKVSKAGQRKFSDGVAKYTSTEMAGILVVLAISMCGMGSSINLEAKAFPDNQWLLILLYTVVFDFLFFLTLVVVYRVPSAELWAELASWRQYSVIGMLWSMNYVFILLSAPYLSNTIQVVLAQTQSVMIAFVDWRYVGILLTARKWFLILLSVCLGLLSIVFNAQSSASAYPAGITAFWSFIFLVNSFAGGLATLNTEALLKVKRRKAVEALVVDEESGLNAGNAFDAGKQVLMLNFASNFYGIFFCLLGIPLALYSNPDKAALVDFSIFLDSRIVYWWCMCLSSFVYTVMAGLITIDQSAIFNAMSSSFGACLQLLFFLTPAVGRYREGFDLKSFALAVSLSVVSGVYVATSDERDMEKLMASLIGRHYTDAIGGQGSRTAFILIGIGLVVYVVSWVGIGLMEL